jgi:L-gulono-1,4-lactone dehydrogenase
MGQVVGVELITGEGRVIRASTDDQDPFLREVLEASKISLGGLGVISELTLECVDAFSIIKVGYVPRIPEALDGL